MRSSGACARAGWAAAVGTSRRSGGALEDSSMSPLSFKTCCCCVQIKQLRVLLGRAAPCESAGDKWNVFGRFSVAFYAGLPVERRNWTDNPKPDFLWVFAADKTPLLHKHSPSCSNRFTNLILRHFSVPIVQQTSWKGGREVSERERGGREEMPADISPQGLLLPLQSRGKYRNHQLFFSYINISDTSAGGSCSLMFSEIQSVKLQLVEAKLLHDKKEVSSRPAAQATGEQTSHVQVSIFIHSMLKWLRGNFKVFFMIPPIIYITYKTTYNVRDLCNSIHCY